MKKGLKSFLKYVLFSGFLSVSAVAAPIASPGTSTVYSGTNSSLIYSPTVTSNNCNLTFLVNEHITGIYVKTVDLSNFANCGSNTMLVIKAAGEKGGGAKGGLGGITILKIPLSTFVQKFGTKVTFYYLVSGGDYPPAMGGPGGRTWAGSHGGWGGGETLVSLNNWPWMGGVPLAVGGGGGGSGAPAGYAGGSGGGGNDPGSNGGCAYFGCGGYTAYEISLLDYRGGKFGQGGPPFGNGAAGGNGWLGRGGAGGNGWLGEGGTGGTSWGGGGGGGAGYGGGGGGNSNVNLSGGDGGGGGGGYCNTSLGICQASDWTNAGGNWGNGYVEIYVENSTEMSKNIDLP